MSSVRAGAGRALRSFRLPSFPRSLDRAFVTATAVLAVAADEPVQPGRKYYLIATNAGRGALSFPARGAFRGRGRVPVGCVHVVCERRGKRPAAEAREPGAGWDAVRVPPGHVVVDARLPDSAVMPEQSGS